MARNRPWRRSRARWLDLFDTWLRFPDRQRVFLATIAFDVRRVAGPLMFEPEIHDLLATAERRPAFLGRLARAALDFRPPTGFLRDFVVERSGEQVGTLDIKRGGVMPVVDLARFYALAAARRASELSTGSAPRALAARSRANGRRSSARRSPRCRVSGWSTKPRWSSGTFRRTTGSTRGNFLHWPAS